MKNLDVIILAFLVCLVSIFLNIFLVNTTIMPIVNILTFLILALMNLLVFIDRD